MGGRTGAEFTLIYIVLQSPHVEQRRADFLITSVIAEDLQAIYNDWTTRIANEQTTRRIRSSDQLEQTTRRELHRQIKVHRRYTIIELRR